jgi:hypothetical protein
MRWQGSCSSFRDRALENQMLRRVALVRSPHRSSRRSSPSWSRWRGNGSDGDRQKSRLRKSTRKTTSGRICRSDQERMEGKAGKGDGMFARGRTWRAHIVAAGGYALHPRHCSDVQRGLRPEKLEESSLSIRKSVRIRISYRIF